MNNNNFLFLAGEFRVTMPAVFSTKNWIHSMIPSKMIFDGENLFRSKFFLRQRLDGVIFYADCDNKQLQLENLELIEKSLIPCWPDVYTLINMIDRIEVLKECILAGFVDHEVKFLTTEEFRQEYFEKTQVAKLTNQHRGQGKHFVNEDSILPEWDGVASFEPFFYGKSVRVLIIGNKTFGIEAINENNWIKNAEGADIVEYNLSKEIIQHAKNVSNHFKLDVAGIDYIVEDNGTFHFLEINQFPGLGSTEEISEIAKEFLKNKMNEIEKLANHVESN